MTEISPLVSYSVSTAFGLVMVAAAAVQADGAPLIAATTAAVAVLLGNLIRPAATLAVLLTVAVIVLANAAPALAALSGLSAVAYLVLRHTGTVATPTVVGAAAFTAAGLAATSIAVRLPWAPLAAPIAVLVLYVLITRPFWREGSTR
jgi:hypothetical protein